MRVIDVSMPLFSGMPAFPGDPPFTSVPVLRSEDGDAYSLSRLGLGSHTGTHLDPPVHFFPGGLSVDRIDLDVLLGPCEVVQVDPARPTVMSEDLEGVPAGTCRLLVRTANSSRWAERLEFFDDFVPLSPGAADRLVRLGVKLVGIDALSVERGLRGEFPVHRQLLGQGVILLEGLLLGEAAPGTYDLCCLPLALRGGDGGPARVVLRAP